MLPDREEVARSLSGAWRLFLDRPEAMRFFDVSIDGFWRSFGAIFLVLPSYALVALAEYTIIHTDSLADEGFSGNLFVFDKALALCLDWIALPLAMALAARPLGVTRTYAAFVVARNWCAVLAILPFGIIGLLLVSGLYDVDAANFLWLAALFIVLRYTFIIARRALGVSTGLAAGIVAIDFFLSFAIGILVDGLIGFSSPP
jgi:hypothetical protein